MVGPWGNASKDLHNLVRTVAECRVDAKDRFRGRESSEHELGLVIGQVRRSLSVDFVWSQSVAFCPDSATLGQGPGQLLAEGRKQPGERRPAGGSRGLTSSPTSRAGE